MFSYYPFIFSTYLFYRKGKLGGRTKGKVREKGEERRGEEKSEERVEVEKEKVEVKFGWVKVFGVFVYFWSTC